MPWNCWPRRPASCSSGTAHRPLWPRTVAISHTGRTKDLLEVLGVAKHGGARTIAITHYGPSPILKLADVVLQTSARETAYRQESLSSRIAALTIVDALYVGVGLRLHEAVTKNLATIRRALRSTRV
jgi:RpiR family carbohydrate utilization transcriptional regulator